MFIKQLTAILALCCCQLATAGGQQITVATDEWQHYTHKDGSGYYLDLLNSIYQAHNITVNVKFVPFQRSIAMVSNGKADMMLGAYKDDKISGHYSARALSAHRVDAALSPDLASNWQGVSSLAGKKVGALKGYALDQYIDVAMEYKEVSKLSSLLKMLDAGRLDAVISDEDEIKKAEMTNKKSGNYVIKTSIINNTTYAVFADNIKGKAMLTLFNEGMEKLHQNGQLKAMMIKTLGNSNNYPE
ncbi:transporter substrate-binding domain-containing protein [Dasania sp. GY-MA-18]|uniref:Transporter substrate-binding domain-containing protein n=1 Tax=Dasania phycosphaerae TaxID=2950436 RepID=A0A9J6RM07_9GAMM|nr:MULTISPECIES: transporter substrate-binding domain-containing protein [Dasania]MCR8922793.1 transporter substrate-binding domain-containing protein [Dasania sp. GY-MA-18]MCZ0865223.1 transporter substrate-binding domain-containing protein [Dasania phycosphaerae]MCZ0868949.1 transporter substrate-binding domain-containing protein [Dasania phycosphaerae]